MLDIFKIGVRIGMTNNVSSVLGVIQKDLFGLNKSVDLTKGKFNAMKLAAVGAMGVIAGAAVLAGLGKLVSAGAEVVHQQQLMVAAGMSNKDIAESTAQAWRTTSTIMGSTITENLKSIRELRMVFGSTAEAIVYLPKMMQAEQIVSAILGHGAGNQVFDLAKALEIKGVSMDPKHFTALLDAMIKAIIASGGKVTGSDFLSAFKFGRSATQGWDDFFVTYILPTLMQEMKGGGGFSGATGPGNALMSAYAAIVGGTMSNKAAEEYFRLHMIKNGSVIYTNTGNVKGIRPGGIIGSTLFASDPYSWVQKVLLPALKAAGITDPAKIRAEIAHLFPNRVAQQIIDMFATMQKRFEKDANLIHQSKGMGAWHGLITKDFVTNWHAFTASLGNFIRAIGVPLVPLATKMLHSLTVRIDELTLWAANNPALAKRIGEVAAGLGTLAVVLGSIAVVVAAGSALAVAFSPAGWILAGLAALTYIALEAPWKTIFADMAAGFRLFSSAVMTLWHDIPSLADITKDMRLFGQEITGLWRDLTNALSIHPLTHGELKRIGTPPGLGAPGGPRYGHPDMSQYAPIHPVVPQPWGPAVPPPSGGANTPRGTSSDPLHTVTHVTNTGDMHNGTAGALAHHLNSAHHGTTGADGSVTLMQPAWAAP